MSAQKTARAGTAAPVAPTPPARLAAGLAVLVALLGSVLGPTGQLDVLLGPEAVTVAAGQVEALAEGEWTPLAVGARVPPGTSVRAPGGAATLAVPGGMVDLAEGSRVTTDPETMLVAAGAVVVRSPAAVVGDGSTVAQGTETWRYDATGRISAYRGSSTVTDATGRATPVRALQEVRVRQGVVAEEPRPYVYADSDPFDRQYLGTAFDVDDYLAALHRGLQGEYGTAPQPTDFYLDFDGLDGLLVSSLGAVGFERVGDRVGPPADVLVSAVVTDAMAVGAGMEAEAAAEEVRDLRLAGATWGLIAQGRDLDASHVRAAADRALARRQLAEQQGTAVPVIPGASAGTGDAPVETPVETPTGDVDAVQDGSAPPPAPSPEPASPSPSDDPADEQGPVGDVIDETGADDLLGEELGGLVDDVVEPADDLLDDVVDTADDLLQGLDPSSSAGDASTPGGAVGGLVDDVGGVVDDVGGVVDDTVGSLLGR